MSTLRLSIIDHQARSSFKRSGHDSYCTNKHEAGKNKIIRKRKKSKRSFERGLLGVWSDIIDLETLGKSTVVKNFNGRTLKILGDDKYAAQNTRKAALEINHRLLSVVERAHIADKIYYERAIRSARNKIFKYLPEEEKQRDMNTFLFGSHERSFPIL
ncbi:hypothetical protein CSB09_04575 [Candidatus Gracilibacteria bacterium]|nr:MAG: hypothetical protein CSB09_04575 [Candidatus Gracilibacteria bacterium]